MASEKMNSVKRKHKVLSVEDKITIISRLENGETGASLAKLYNVGRATIFDIKCKKDKLLKFASKFNCSKNGIKNRKTMKKVGNEQLENALYSWYLHMRDQGEHITGPLLCARALQLNQIYEGSRDFRASSGWLRNFKTRYGIGVRELEMRGDNLPCDFPATNGYNEYIRKATAGEALTNDVLPQWLDQGSAAIIKKEHATETENNHESKDLLIQNISFNEPNETSIDSEEEKDLLSGPTHAEAFVAVETAMEWYEQQSECTSPEIFLLKKMRDLAAKKHKIGWSKRKKNTKIKYSR